MATMTLSSDLISRIDAYYSKKLLYHVDNNVVTPMTAIKESIPKNNTKTIRKREVGDFNKFADPLTEGVTPEGQSYSDTSLTAVCKQYGDFSITTDVEEMTVKDPVLREMQGRMQQAAKDTIEYLNLTTLLGTSNKYGVDTTSDDDGLLDSYTLSNIDGFMSETSILSMINKLTQNKSKTFRDSINSNSNTATQGIADGYIVFVPRVIETQLVSVISGSSLGTLKQNYPNPSAALPDEIGALYKARFVLADMIDEMGALGTGTNSEDVYPTFWLGQYAWMTVKLGNGDMQAINKPFGHGDDRLDQRASVGYKFWHVAKITDDNFLARLDTEIV